jgi:competence protein ComEA
MFKKIIAFIVMMCAAIAFAAVDVNKGTAADLDGIKGIGPVTSKLITTERDKGAFKDWPDFIARVKGVGDKRAAKLSANGLTVNGAAFDGKPTAAGKPVTTKIADDAKAVAKKTKEVAVDAKDKVTGK